MSEMLHSDVDAETNRITEAIIDAALEVHRELGPGLLERAYRDCLVHELRSRGLDVEVEVPMPLSYKGIDVGAAYRLDIVVEGRVIIEVKAVSVLTTVHAAQLHTYLKLTGRNIGLLINFDEKMLKYGLRRVIRTPA